MTTDKIVVHFISTGSLTQKTRTVEVPREVKKEVDAFYREKEGKVVPTVWTETHDANNPASLKTTLEHFQDHAHRGGGGVCDVTATAAKAVPLVVVITEMPM